MKAEWLKRLEQTLEKHQHVPSAVFAQLATVNPENKPANRSVVFRSFLDTALVFATRKDSEKVTHLQKNPFAELCWYFTETREQYRLSGTCKIIDGSDTQLQDTRVSLWQTLSESAKQMFTWPASGDDLVNREAFAYPVPDFIPEQFIVLILKPSQVDILDLRPTPHQRQCYEWTLGVWQCRDINP